MRRRLLLVMAGGLGLLVGCGTVDRPSEDAPPGTVDGRTGDGGSPADGRVDDGPGIDANVAHENEVCSDSGDPALPPPCETGLKCCYPCGVDGCENICMVPCTDGACAGGCPLFP
jgi:hypothetical protein